MIKQQMNCNAGHRYFVRIKVPDGVDMVEPTEAGTVTGVKYRFSDEKPRLAPDGLSMVGGEAIDPDLDDLAMTEDADDPALFTVDVSQALHQTYLRPLGRGAEYYGIASKDGVGDFEVDTFIVAISSSI
jgi:hypothetical protein